MQQATFGAGCFWCVEAVFQRLRGVKSVVSGYSGGHTESPSYEQVCSGDTGHAEVCQIEFDPGIISYEELLDVFFSIHDPTTLNRQGDDLGTQYRSVIFYHDDEQRATAERVKNRLALSGKRKRPIITQIVAFSRFYRAEDYHQDYFRRNPTQQYCRIVVAPKVENFEQVFRLKLTR